jgi:hypothetical protein
MCVGLIVLACNRAPTLLVENVSGEGQEVNVWADKEVLAVSRHLKFHP